jgi:hypothetical protein
MKSRLALPWFVLSVTLLCPAQTQTPAGERSPRLKLDETLGGRLATECASVVHSPEVLLAPQPTFRDRVLLAAGDPKQMSRRQLDSLGLDLEIASFRDAGLLLELNYRPAEDRRALLPTLWEKWEGLRGSALRDEYYVALVRALVFRQGEGVRKRAVDQGFTDRLLISAGEIRTLTRQRIDDLYRDFLREEQRDAGFALEAAGQRGTPDEREKLREKWSALRGAALEAEYYSVVSKTLASLEKTAGAKSTGQRTLTEALVLEAGRPAGLSRDDVDVLFPLFQIASRCDESRKRPPRRRGANP